MMDFTLANWQQAVSDTLRTIGDLLNRGKEQEAPYLLYGALCGLSLWPLVEAAQGGQLLPAMMALGGVAAGVGGNLIAEQVQRWKDQADKVDTSEIADWVAGNAATNPDLRDALDAILQKLDTITEAKAALDESEWPWFVETLREELVQLGTLARFETTLVGSGSIAQGAGAKAAGERGVVVDTIKNSVVLTGDHNRTIQTGTYVERQIAEGHPTSTLAALQVAYLNRLFEMTNHVSLAGVDPKAASELDARLRLDAVYTALLTSGTEADKQLARGHVPEQNVEHPSALTQLNRHPLLVLLGDPGSGKSTFVNFVTMCLAGEALGRKEANLALLAAPLPDDEGTDRGKPQPWDHGALLPVHVVLRDFAARGLPPLGEDATAGHLWAFIVAGLEAAALGEYADHLRCHLMEQGGLILLDGLDEVPEADDRRVQIKQTVEDFSSTFAKCRVLATSRTYAYQKQGWRLQGYAEAVLAPFSRGQIRGFVDRWYTHIAALRGMHPDDAQGRAELLKRAIFGSDRLSVLAQRPLLLTLMASLHAWRGGTLPEKREELYADTVDLLLDWWESPKVVRDAAGQVLTGQPSLAEWLKVDREKVRALLNELAYQTHASQSELMGTADVPEGDLLGRLMRLSQNPDVNPARLVEYLSQRAGLLLPRGTGVYTYPHRTFQEYLAACYLTDHDYPDLVANLARQEPNRWREVALLAGAKAARGTASAIWSLVDAMCYNEPREGTIRSADAWGAHIAGQVMAEMANLTQVSERNRPKVERVRAWLVQILRSDEFPAVERAAAGRSLARIGDPRFRPDAWYLPDEPLLGFVKVPAGPFLMGTREEDIPALLGLLSELEKGGDEDSAEERRWYIEREIPQHEVILPTYHIARYPVTNAQFQVFREDPGGYRVDRWWTEAGLEWREGQKKPKSIFQGQPYDLPNHPAADVAWQEALAFTRWLTDMLRDWKEAPDPLRRLLGDEGWVVTLPSEAEWEKAARGTDGRIFPWGNGANQNLANSEATSVGMTSAVGCFPDGSSPYRVEDMIGNVWEWTRSLWREAKDGMSDSKYPYDPGGGREDLYAGNDVYRMVRGGAFYGHYTRCAERNGALPDDVSKAAIGFRIVVASL
jgi:formylglycine-generating enzyme required for sulfatase activity